MIDNIKEILREIGFSDGESKAYIALIKLGTSSVGDITKLSGVSASKIYLILDRLMKKGLVSINASSKRKEYRALDPEKLMDYLDEKEKKIKEYKEKTNDILPLLKQMKDEKKERVPEVEIIKGKRGFIQIHEEIINSAKNEFKYYGIAGINTSFAMQDYWFNASKIMSEKGIKQYLVYEYDGWYKKDPKVHRRKERKLYYPRVLDKRFGELANIQIVDSKGIINEVDSDGEIFSLIIRNKNLVNSLKRLVKILYSIAETPEGYEKIDII